MNLHEPLACLQYYGGTSTSSIVLYQRRTSIRYYYLSCVLRFLGFETSATRIVLCRTLTAKHHKPTKAEFVLEDHPRYLTFDVCLAECCVVVPQSSSLSLEIIL
jgi:hypothetical protein